MKRSLFWIPNGITILRFVLTAWFIRIVAGGPLGGPVSPFAAPYLLFAGICLSDLADGAAARRLKAESALGSILDVLADSLFILSSLLLFDWFHVLPVWFTAFVVADFLVFLATSRLLSRVKRKSARRPLVFDLPGKSAAILFYFIPISAWTAFNYPAPQSLWVLRALLFASLLLAGISLSQRLFLCFAAPRDAKGLRLTENRRQCGDE